MMMLFVSLLLNIPLGVAGVVATWDLDSTIHNGSLLTDVVFWLLFVGWGVSLGRRYKRTGDPRSGRATVELFVLYGVVAGVAALSGFVAG